MAIESINREFEVFMREMVKSQECVQENIESEFRRLLRVTVNSCATMYGFSAAEALKRLNSSGEIIEVPLVPPIQQKEAEKAEKLRLKEAEKAEKLALKEAEKAEKAEKLALKEAEKAEKLRVKAFEKTENLRRKEYENAKKNQLKELEEAAKVNESSERTLMKGEDISSKVAEKLAQKALQKAEKPAKKQKKTKKVEKVVDDSDASTVIMSASEDEEPFVRFQNIPLIKEINSIRDVKKTKNWKKLSPGVKLARQILDI
jgi:hypothetical protein